MAVTKRRPTPLDQLKSAVKELFVQQSLPWTAADETSIPKHWELFENLILLPENSFQTPTFLSVSDQLWPVVGAVFHVSRVARHGRIQADDFRSPRLEMLSGTDTWVRKRENGVIYELDLAKSMFSSGNGTEKARMRDTQCHGETIVDLFAGIGYFTIPLLKAGARMVYACEWNTDAVKALERNLQLNHVSVRCMVLPGDNRLVAPVGVADRVILGLIPSSEISWRTAIACLKQDVGGVLHVHANADLPRTAKTLSSIAPDSPGVVSPEPGKKSDNRKEYFHQFGLNVLQSLLVICSDSTSHVWTGQLLHSQCVKSYGPNIFHFVFDIELRPKCET